MPSPHWPFPFLLSFFNPLFTPLTGFVIWWLKSTDPYILEIKGSDRDHSQHCGAKCDIGSKLLSYKIVRLSVTVLFCKQLCRIKYSCVLCSTTSIVYSVNVLNNLSGLLTTVNRASGHLYAHSWKQCRPGVWSTLINSALSLEVGPVWNKTTYCSAVTVRKGIWDPATEHQTRSECV